MLNTSIVSFLVQSVGQQFLMKLFVWKQEKGINEEVHIRGVRRESQKRNNIVDPNEILCDNFE